MLFKKKSSRKKIVKKSIVSKMILATLLFTVIPLLISGGLIIYAYQSLISRIFTVGGINLGEKVMMGFSLSLEDTRAQTILTLFIVVVLTLFSNILISQNLTRPLRRMVKGMNEIAKGNLDFKIKVDSEDELGELSVYFNEMTQQLKEMTTALEGSKKTLEKRVQARTKELEEAKEALETAKTTLEIKVRARTKELEEFSKRLDEQVKLKTKELQSKIDELERFRKLTVDRELKMIEMKNELKKLRKK